MNTDYDPNVKEIKERMDPNLALSMPEATYYEGRLAKGMPYRPIIFLLCVTNCAIYAQRKNLLTNRNFFLGSLLLSIPITYYVAQYAFGYRKLRDLIKSDQDTRMSVEYYRKLTEEKKN